MRITMLFILIIQSIALLTLSIMVWLFEKVHLYESNQWILSAEIVFSVWVVLWSTLQLIKIIRR